MRKIFTKPRGLLAPLLCIVVLSSTAMANEKKVVKVEENNQSMQQWYGGIGFTTARAKCLNGCEDITYGIVAKVGVDFNKYIGGEVRAIKTFLAYEQQEIQHFGLYVKPMLPINDESHLYGLLGYGSISTGDKIVYDDSGLTWGVGFQYNFFDDKEDLKEQVEELKETQKLQKKLREFDAKGGFGIFIDYQRLLQKSNTPDFDAVNMGVVYNF